jgi:hypothetical protein
VFEVARQHRRLSGIQWHYPCDLQYYTRNSIPLFEHENTHPNPPSGLRRCFHRRGREDEFHASPYAAAYFRADCGSARRESSDLPRAIRWPPVARFIPYRQRITQTKQDGAPISVKITPDKPEALLECIRECRFPSQFTPPKAVPDETFGIVPMTPTDFETVNTGWTIRLKAKPEGRLVQLYGIADYTEAELLPGGYGPLSEPIYSKKGELISPNVLTQPKFETTTTRFCIFAVPGEPYEVTLYRGAKAEKHTVTVTAE